MAAGSPSSGAALAGRLQADGLVQPFGTNPFGTTSARDHFRGLLFGPKTVFY